MNAAAVIDGPKDPPDWNAFGADVQKIVLGTLEDDADGSSLAKLRTLPADLARRFPKLTHLYLWNLAALESLPELPPRLRCLDVRGATKLNRLPALPALLHTLVLQRCPALEHLPLANPTLPELEDLSLAGSAALLDADLQALVRGTPKLRYGDLSGCAKLTTVDEWPADLDDLRLNDCTRLVSLPEWPLQLRRLELRGTPLSSLNDLPDSIDYVDLGGMRQLRALPERWGKPRTLFLFGSGLQAPPASEHGAAADENVADRSRRYFADRDLTGSGTVQRCKVLLLGNGGAGKTCLALRLVGDDPARTRHDYEPACDRLGSTHGVQFHAWSVPIQDGAKKSTAAVHLWDFGGQDIYHNTHRLFVGVGTVFVLVWNPDAPTEAEPVEPGVYCDRPRSLGYWLDYIEQATAPLTPEIVLVCSHRAASDETAKRRLRAEVGAERFAKHRLFFADALAGMGDLEGLKKELALRIAAVVKAQGSVVPAYWEVAQTLVQGWIEKGELDATFAKQSRQMPRAQFAEEMQRAIADVCRGTAPKYRPLRAAVKAGTFVLDDDRVVRTLEFLCRSGWVYWDRELLEQRVIVGQKWALDGVYTLLERMRDGKPSSVFAELVRHHGRFTLPDLERWGWGELVQDAADRKLLLTFLERVGLCFTLVRGEDSWWGRPTYVSLAHLPPRTDAGFAAAFAELVDGTYARTWTDWQRVEHDRLHQGHWDAILRAFGKHFGTDGRYARDGFVAATNKQQRVHVEFDLADSGFGGCLRVRACGPDDKALADEVTKRLQSEVAAVVAHRSADGDAAAKVSEPEGALSVFLSYAWDPEDEPPRGYQVPVDRIQAALEKPAVRVLRDRLVLKRGDSIVDYSRQIKNTDRVVIVHSDRFWKSDYCMFELTEFVHETHNSEKSFGNVTLVAHLQSDFDRDGKKSAGPLKDPHAVKVVKTHWAVRDKDDLRPALKKVTSVERLRTAITYLLDHVVPDLADVIDREIVWDDARADAIVKRIVDEVLRDRPAAK